MRRPTRERYELAAAAHKQVYVMWRVVRQCGSVHLHRRAEDRLVAFFGETREAAERETVPKWKLKEMNCGVVHTMSIQ